MKPRPVTYKQNIATITYRGETLINVMSAAMNVLQNGPADRMDVIALAAGYQYLMCENTKLRKALDDIAKKDPLKITSMGDIARKTLGDWKRGTL